MLRALELAERGRGWVEPNPLVGCVIVRDGEIVGEGFHERFGGPHAEIHALQNAGERASGATLYVTLEPCCHFGKTPPCAAAVIAARVRKVVAAMRDPFPKVDGGGFEQLRQAGIEVEIDTASEAAARRLNGPYLKLIERGRPWVIAQWAMSLDGKIATHPGDSKWISGPASRQIVHELRARVDAIVVGRRTAELDDPLLTARIEREDATPAPLPRVATRIVLDSRAQLPLSSKLVATAHQAPVLVAVGPEADAARVNDLRAAGCEVYCCPGDTRAERLAALFDELGRRRMTNVLVEGGAEVLGALLEGRLADEAHVFIAPKIIGGGSAPGPVGGAGVRLIGDALQLDDVRLRHVGADVYVAGTFQV